MKQLTIGGEEIIIPTKAERHMAQTLGVMHKRYGLSRNYAGAPTQYTCGQCQHFLETEFANRYFKCSKFGVSSGPATDWRKGWQACGAFEKPV